MEFGTRFWLKKDRKSNFTWRVLRYLNHLVELLRIPAPEVPQLVRRITIMERNILLPIKAAGIAMLFYSFYYKRAWFGNVLSALDIAVESTLYFLWIYAAINLVVGVLLLAIRHVPPALIQWVVFVICLIDSIFLSALTVVTGGYDSFLYWLFLALTVRAAVSVSRATSQIALNLTVIACYVVAGLVDIAVADYVHVILGSSEPSDNPTEPLLLRLVLLVLMTVCCYGVQVLFERHRQVLEEAREFAAREGQLRSAGRMAAEFVHQMKNPLAIINNAAYSLQRAWKEGKSNGQQQIQIIQEEVARSDRIITQIMGYAQLSEGRVEKVDVIEALEEAIARVFPPAAGYPVQIHRRYDSRFPPLLMQRRHVSDTFLNLLQNAREALEGRPGEVLVEARCRSDYSIEVTIADNGPGIPTDRHEQIFEAYYSTKEKGTGLGLATVKHNVELYGGSVRLQSELGKGARFTLLFPARSLIRLDLQT